MGHPKSHARLKKKKFPPYPTSDMSDEDVLRMYDYKYPKTTRLSIGDLKNKDKVMYMELKRRKLVLSALFNERYWG